MLKFVKESVIALLGSTGSLACIAKVSDRAKCISPNNGPCIARSTLIDLNLKERYCYPFMVSLDRYNRNFNILDDSSSGIHAPNKTEDVNFNLLNMIRGINK